MKQRNHIPQSLRERQENRLLALACRRASEGLARDIALGYRQGRRCADRRHTVATLVVGLCLMVSVAGLVGWMHPYTMSGGDRQERIAAFENTRQILRQI